METKSNDIRNDASRGEDKTTQSQFYKRILVCGGRDFFDKEFVNRYLDSIKSKLSPDAIIIDGEAKGADTLAYEWAKSRGYKSLRFPAKWDDLNHPEAIIKINKFGKEYNVNAGFIRNKQMLDEGQPDLVIAFPGGNGTENMIRQSVERKIKVLRILRTKSTQANSQQ